ncbi:MAG: alpha/beta hydrolase [Victivallales bacterium]|nr:alpha/beta hydrolase [Victivallales bacterium]
MKTYTNVSKYVLFKYAAYDIPAAEPLFPEPNAGLADDSSSPEIVEDRQADYWCRFIANVRKPAMYSFPAHPLNNNGKAVVVCPGGGYRGVAIDHEGFEVARMLNQWGYSAFVVKYRDPAPDEKGGTFPNGPLDDALRAMRLVRSRAARYGIRPDKIGVMGFSAGGHLAGNVSTIWQTRHDLNPELEKVSARPDFSILIYAVLSLSDSWSHSGSRVRLLGNADEETRRLYSATLQVTKDTPPAFLVTTEDDFVDSRHSFEYFLACKRAGVPCELHAYQDGGHGYGMRLRGLAIDTWPSRLCDWLARF